MINKKLEKAINEQINKEMFSAYLYLSMSAYFEDENFPGFAKWMNEQAKEEQLHAMKLFNYLIERGGRVELMALEKPQQEWDSVNSVFEDALEHERYITGSINDLMDVAIELKDHATTSLLQWYVDEQVEEESTAEGIVAQLNRIDGQSGPLFVLDRELGSRTSDGEI